MTTLNAVSSLNTIGQAGYDSAQIAGNFNTFLQLLTTQLRNQNPLDPLDTNQFTQQLVQFAGVEQSIKTNQNLELMIQLAAANTATAATSFIGKKVMIQSATQTLEGESAKWSYVSGSDATAATFTVRDEQGNIVWEETKDLLRGRNDYVWNGHDNDGNVVQEGKYTLTIEATDADGKVVPVAIEVSVKIDGVDFSGSEPVLLAGDEGIPLSQVTAVLGI